MGRWEPNALERLQDAAMQLFQERGYDRTTVEEIAARAGLTERTFFRYFADKREVLFSRSKELEALIVNAIADAPKEMAPIDVVAAALEALSPGFEERRAHAAKRQPLILAHAELRERELIKLASLASAMAESLRGRGVEKTVANLVAEAGIAIFKSAFERWVEDTKKHELAHHVRVALAELRLITAGASVAPSSPLPTRKVPRRSRSTSR
ncbi:TetR family transcriptional regulator [Myxococcus llanfairpwllgwyngyllgogerychwyrndrobwllllantysiliogogogochensis]|uniref:TetR family transcriptional regulator n=1 Tax=Myxococcus llanfairpwllgwyngyllgogerychwyrndrobwllllantysiliogogogochensis TaxID=2590453 RepID=A0A540WP37_9BACT|nr:TetR family transcriptional regulator [Myxococcus llanfairpwllgwyngyllgogerychwyrndrobwllllantysiliogogogochensis]TQF10792.1 TetR family transcriptional regulator [Myxococcus llanfairpwllgwyngyllgogerychwyrndrobwllllantysiliogogogochensis]